MVLPNLALGVSWQWRTIQETTSDAIALDGMSVSGDQVRRIYVSPILVNAVYYYGGLEDSWRVKPFAGAGIGTYYIDKNLGMGITDIKETTWHFGLSPSAGIIFPLYNSSIDGFLDFNYHYILEAGDDTSHSFWGIEIGFAFRK
jgi:hypothetical protein